MDIKTQLEQTLKEAMRANDDVRKRAVRMVIAAIKNSEIDKRAAVDDAAVMAILQKEIKNRRESIEEAKKANRADLIEATEAEIAVLSAFLPKGMSEDELRELVKAAIAEVGATAQTDMGKVMKAVMPKVAGRAPGDAISAMVKSLLTA